MKPAAAPARRTTRGAVASLIAAALLAVGCGDDSPGPTNGASTPERTADAIVIGVQDAGESEVLSHVYGEYLTARDYQVTYQLLGGLRDSLYPAFAERRVNFAVEYTASALQYLLSAAGKPTGSAGPDARTAADSLRAELASRGLTAFTPAAAVAADSLVMTRSLAEARGITMISQLTPDLRLGGPAECATDARCIPGLRETYGIDLAAGFVPLDRGGPRTKAALDAGDVDVAVMSSTDSSLTTKPWIRLSDDKALFAADVVIPTLTMRLATSGGEVLESYVDAVSAELTTERLIAMNTSFDVDHRDPAEVARTFLTDVGLT